MKNSILSQHYNCKVYWKLSFMQKLIIASNRKSNMLICCIKQSIFNLLILIAFNTILSFCPIDLFAQKDQQFNHYPDTYQNSHMNKFNLTEIPQLNEKIKKIYRDGSMEFNDNSKLSQVEILNYLNVGSNTTFKIQTERSSIFNNNISCSRYQQYYKAIKVENGGYVIKIDNNQVANNSKIKLLTPFLLYGINLDTAPNINLNHLKEILGNPKILQTELLISDRFKNEFQLIWKVRFNGSGAKEAWVDAQNGQILHMKDGYSFKNAPTEDYGQKSMVDVNIGNTTYLQTEADPENNGGIVTYDFELANLYELDETDFTSNLIPTSTPGIEWSDSDAAENVFQAHWIITQLKQRFYDDFGIDFQLLHVGANCDNYVEVMMQPVQSPNAAALTISDLDEGWIIIGHSENSTLAEFDVLAHELTHVFLLEYLYPGIFGQDAIEEGIADMFGVYMESVFQSLDWQIADDVPLVVRDLSNPGAWGCYYLVENSLSPHRRGQPLGYWFYNLVTENELECVEPLDMKTVLDIIVEAVLTLPPYADYPQLVVATLSIAEQEYGLQSNEYKAIYMAWEKICIIPPPTPLDPDVHIETTQTWTSDMTINYDIYIEKGASLTVACTLTMMPGVDIYVKDDSELIVDGGTLTTNIEDCQRWWNGIHVDGEFDAHSPFPQDEEGFVRGRVYLKNDALLERAIIGIDAKDRYVTPQGKVYEFGGGIVDVRNSKIKECSTGIRFGRYGWGSVFGTGLTDDPSYISTSIFESNSTAIYSEYN